MSEPVPVLTLRSEEDDDAWRHLLEPFETIETKEDFRLATFVESMYEPTTTYFHGTKKKSTHRVRPKKFTKQSLRLATRLFFTRGGHTTGIGPCSDKVMDRTVHNVQCTCEKHNKLIYAMVI